MDERVMAEWERIWDRKPEKPRPTPIVNKPTIIAKQAGTNLVRAN